VLVVSIDGLRPDAIERFEPPNLRRLMREGSYTLRAQTVLPSTTLPSHVSMLTGELPAAHGVTWNDDETDRGGVLKVPTVFAVAHQRGFKTAAFFAKSKLRTLDLPGTLDHVEGPEGSDTWKSERVVDAVRDYLRDEKPNLFFVHLGEPDYAGHTFSWMSWWYGRAVTKADDGLGELLAAADEAFGEGEYTVIVTADHGGHGWSHGSDDPRDLTIPWITWGEGVRPGVVIDGPVRTVDTASTALWLLGLPALGEGVVVRSAYAVPVAPGASSRSRPTD
jgi:predicted AlkP superfamily pyrophosphatase or phosphodiesterase